MLVIQVAEALNFVHTEANLVHRAISPETVIVTAGGAWKLAGLGLAGMAELNTRHPENKTFTYNDSMPALWDRLSKVDSVRQVI